MNSDTNSSTSRVWNLPGSSVLMALPTGMGIEKDRSAMYRGFAVQMKRQKVNGSYRVSIWPGPMIEQMTPENKTRRIHPRTRQRLASSGALFSDTVSVLDYNCAYTTLDVHSTGDSQAMPAPVDHEARRREVIKIAASVLADRGPDALSFREIAERAGYSTTIITHYFRNKHDLLLSMFQAAAQGGVDRVNAAIQQGKPAQECLEALLPMNEESRRNWRVVLAFWGNGTADDAFRREQRMRWHESLDMVMEQLQRLDADHSTPLELRGRTILALMIGLATQAVFNPREWTANHMRRSLRAALESISANGKK
jgi:AcrR family transcriptional regulator